jgi:hypothetical protein
MITFNVVEEQHGWAVRMGQRMTTPFRSKSLAVWEANRLAEGIRRHGELIEVIVEGAEAPAPSTALRRSKVAAPPPVIDREEPSSSLYA